MPYNPALFTGRIVGTMTWTPTSTIDGMLVYSVDGVGVSKSITRQTLVNEYISKCKVCGSRRDGVSPSDCTHSFQAFAVRKTLST
jgi:hypothetical protein